jgi:hypothetical protein
LHQLERSQKACALCLQPFLDTSPAIFHDLAKITSSSRLAKLSVTSSPDLAELAKAFKQAGAQLTLLAHNSGVAQGDAIMKALNGLGNIEKSVADLRQEFIDFRD